MPHPLPALPEDNTSICVVLPDSAEFRQLYMGALLALTRWYYYDVTDETDAESVVNRVSECLYLTMQDYGNCMTDCDAILQCVLTNDALRNEITNIAINGVSAQLDSLSNATYESHDLSHGQNTTCNYDNLFGMVTGLVDLYQNLALDIIEIMTASANNIGRIGDLVEAIPIIGELPFDDIQQFAENFVDDLEQNYQANYTLSLRDEYRCDLFCLAVDNNCVLTLAMVTDYFATRLQHDFQQLDMEDVLEYFTQGAFTGVELVHAWHTFVSLLMQYGGIILGLHFERFIKMVAVLWNDPDSDHSILCDCFNEPDYSFDFTSQNSWTIINITGQNRATWVVNEGYDDVWQDTRWRTAIFYDFGQSVTISKIEIDFKHQLAGVTNIISLYKDPVQGSSLGTLVETINISTNGELTRTFETQFTPSTNKICFQGVNGTQNSQVTHGDHIIRRVRIWTT